MAWIKYEEDFTYWPYLFLDDDEVIAFGWLWWTFEVKRKPEGGGE